MPKAMQYTKGSIIYFEGDKDERIFIMQSGAVLLSSTDMESGLPVAEQVKSGEFSIAIGKIDDKDYLRLACAKVDVQEVKHGCKILASFYLNKDTRALLASCLYSIGTKHEVDLTLYNHDASILHHYGTATMKINKKHFSCDVNSDDTPFIEILFISC